MSKQLDTFKSNLEEFASKHKQEIRKNPQFRVQFQEMCATIGVDPLACEAPPVYHLNILQSQNMNFNTTNSFFFHSW